jgi:opacity protein-like surface antigen
MKAQVSYAVACLAMLSSAQAGNYRNSPFDGFYLGAGGSWEQYNTEIEVFGVDIDDVLGNPLDTNGFEAGKVFAGFGMRNGALYGGIEAFASFTGSEIVFPFDTVDYPGLFDPMTAGPSEAFLRANYSFGGSARVGLFMTDRAMVFAKGTATATSFDGGVSGAVLNGTPFQGSVVSIEEKVTAYGFGAGVEYAATDNVFVRADYDQLWYANFDVTAPDFELETGYRSVTLSLGYRF